MTEHNANEAEEPAFAEGFAGISLSELARMSDAELAAWQSGWKAGTVKHILAEKEWQRRIALRNLREQFKLDERIANGNRWWSIAAAAIGVIGTLFGVWLGKQSEPNLQFAKPQESATISTAPTQLPTSSNSVTLAGPSTTSHPEKKTQ